MASGVAGARLLGGTALARAAAALARRGARLVLAEVADHRAAGGVVHFLVAGPPVAQSAGFLAGDFAQQQEVVAGAEARAFQQRVGALADRKSTRLNSSHVK